MNNKLLVGEYENFPEETRKVVEDEGGLEPFLLKSLRFIMVDNLIGLRKHSVLLEGNPSRNGNQEQNDKAGEFRGNSSHSNPPLNPYAQEFKPLSYPLEPPLSAPPDFTDYETPQYLPCSFPAPCTPGNPLENQGVDSLESQAAFPAVLLEGFDPADPAVFLPQSSWGYQYGILPLPAALAQPALIYAEPAARQGNLQSAIPCGKYGPEGFVPAGIQEDKGLWGSDKEDPALPNASCEAEGGKLAEKEKGRKNKAGMKSNPHTRMVAVQVRDGDGTGLGRL